MIRWVERRRDRARARRSVRAINERGERRRFWEDVEDRSIETLSRERRPLNDLFEKGVGLPDVAVLLEYVAALERRVDRLERLPKLADDRAAEERRRGWQEDDPSP